MSGTSLDGVDVVIVNFNNDKPVVISTYFEAYCDELLTSIKNACRQSSINFEDLGQLDAKLGLFYAQCIQNSLHEAKLRPTDIIAIGSHGQTVQHSPNSNPPYTLQIGDANRIAEHTGIAVVADFRRRDVAAGGQGAPLVSAFHQAVFQNAMESLAVVNVGGISNVTFLAKQQKDRIIGFDCGPGNTLMDQWCQLHFDVPYDKAGELSKTGCVNTALLASLLSDEYFSKPYPKSTGPEYFNLSWLHAHLDKHPANKLDTLSSLCELTAICIRRSVQQLPSVDKVLICGGGANNLNLLSRLNELMDGPVSTTKSYGVSPDWLEAIAFAWLAKQTMEGKHSNIPSVTGAKKAVILGVVYPA
ncbi:MAG: anhydro-N-acetylmuramic acid kinase [Cycloclasticus sp. symbiont of Poecilosclerida sp. N]|nr:MAG: anhydro-N-acetylmuramic acid kinase [Cycloclasticus sp. symbiont of Poecilosclerida sp. N]